MKLSSKIYFSILFVSTAILALSLNLTPVYGDEVKLELSLQSTAILPGRQTILHIAFPGESDSFQPEIPFIRGIDVRYKSKSTDKRGRDIYSYRLIPLSGGTFNVGPLNYSRGGITYTSNTVELHVSREAVDALEKITEDKDQQPDVPTLSERIFLEVDFPDLPVYVNQKVPVKVQFYTDWLDIENLSVSESKGDLFVSEQYIPGDTFFDSRENTKFAVVNFTKWFFVPEPGEYEFGPVRASYTLTRRKADLLNNNEGFYNDILGRRSEKKKEALYPAIPFTVIPIPSRGAPETFMGAIGQFDLDVEVSPREVQVGDSVAVEIRITGPGNPDTINVPVFGDSEYMSPFPPHITKISNGIKVRKVFRVLNFKAREIPEITFSYFDPSKSEFVEINEPALGIALTGDPFMEAEEMDVIDEAEPEEEAETLIGIKKYPGSPAKTDPFFYKSSWFASVMIMPLFSLFFAAGFKKRRDILSADTAYSRLFWSTREAKEDLQLAQKHLNAQEIDPFYRRIYLTLCKYLGTRFSVSINDINESFIEEKLSAVLEDRYIREIKDILLECSFARYSKLVFKEPNMKKTYKRVDDIIKRLSRIKKI